MKNLLLSLLAIIAISCTIQAQTLPDVMVKKLDGTELSALEFDNDGQPILIMFWATWCKPCILELNTVHEEYADLQDETGVKIIAISIDDARNSAKVKPFVNGKEWNYEVYIDETSALKNAMGVVNVPHTFLLDGNKNIVWEHNSYSPGDEEELFEQVKLVSNK